MEQEMVKEKNIDIKIMRMKKYLKENIQME